MQERGWGCRTARGAILRGSYEQAETAELKPWLGPLQQAGIGCGRGTVPELDQLMEPGLRAVGQDGKGLVCVCVRLHVYWKSQLPWIPMASHRDGIIPSLYHHSLDQW